MPLNKETKPNQTLLLASTQSAAIVRTDTMNVSFYLSVNRCATG